MATVDERLSTEKYRFLHDACRTGGLIKYWHFACLRVVCVCRNGAEKRLQPRDDTLNQNAKKYRKELLVLEHINAMLFTLASRPV